MAEHAGFVYAFLAIGRDLEGSRVLKIGRTIDWEKRRAAYMGLDAPDPDTLLVRRTSAPVLLEATTKRMLMEMFRVHSGYERFVVPEASAASVMRWVAATIDTHPLDARLRDVLKNKREAKKRKFCRLSSAADHMLDGREERDATADSVQREEEDYVAHNENAVSAIQAPVSNRRRLADGPGMPQKTLTQCADIHGLWIEYVGNDGKSGLRRRTAENPKWHGEGKGNELSRKLFQDKMFREIARQAKALGSIAAATAAVQARLDSYKKPGRGGWAFTRVLRMEQPTEDGTRERLNQLLKSLEVCAHSSLNDSVDMNQRALASA